MSIEVIYDKFGMEIRFTEERWDYIVSKRHILRKFRKQLIDTIMEPEYIKKSVYGPEVVLYYKHFKDILGGKYMVAVIKINKRLKISYDKEGDILEISAGEPEEAISEEIGDDIVVHKNVKEELVGFTILNFMKRFEKAEKEDLPISADFVVLSKT